MDELIERIYSERKVVGRSGDVHALHSEIGRQSGVFLSSIIKNDPAICRTLEVGCAYGLSALHICDALRGREGAHHTMIDPDQTTAWDGAGIANLEKAEIDFFELIESPSEIALPRLLETDEGAFDLVFVDGWHTFDHALLDCFYATRLLRVGGVLVLDDANWPSLRRVTAFLKNYPCYEKLGSVRNRSERWYIRVLATALSFPFGRRFWARILNPALVQQVFEPKADMIALKKVSPDDRSWTWHDDAF